MYRICIATGSRADYGLLKNIICCLNECDELDVKLVVTGSHLDKKYGYTINEILQDGIEIAERIYINTCNDNSYSMSESVAEGVSGFSKYFKDNKLDLFIVLGDRYEAYAACTAACIMGIPIAHIAGGDITEGAIDDTFRHCITKMSFLHFTCCEQSRLRVIQMGENPRRVFNVGSPGVENALRMSYLSREELAKETGLDAFLADYAIVTFHPATMDGDSQVVLQQLENLIDAIKSNKEISYICTLSNADAAGNLINDRWIEAEQEIENIFIVPSLGVKKYLSAIKYCKYVIGNSSSGIVEVPAFKKPTINIGNRQKGRMQAKSIINCEPKKSDIITAMNRAICDDFLNDIKDVESPFGCGNTSEKIRDIILYHFNNDLISSRKQFLDINYSLLEE